MDKQASLSNLNDILMIAVYSTQAQPGRSYSVFGATQNTPTPWPRLTQAQLIEIYVNSYFFSNAFLYLYEPILERFSIETATCPQSSALGNSRLIV